MKPLKDQLHQTLQELHEQLESAAEIDDETRALLSDALAEIRTKLQAADEPASESQTDETLLDRLNHAGQEVEASHPQLATTLGSIAEALRQLGI